MSADRPPSSTARGLEDWLWPDGPADDVWMIVDAARESTVFGNLLERFHSSHICLLTGAIGPELQLAAPYLIHLEDRDEGTRAFLRQAWGRSWGVCLKCKIAPESLIRHLRRILSVRDVSGRQLMFRYYDPRVLRAFLPMCDSAQLQEIFGPIARFVVEDEDPARLLDFSLTRSSLVTDSHSLI